MTQKSATRWLFLSGLKQLWEKVVPKNLPLEGLILKITCLVTILGGVAGVLFNLSIQMPMQINAVIMICVVASTWLFIKMPLYSHYNRSGLILIVIDLLTLAFNWFPNGGSYSSTPYFLMMLICIEALILTGIYLVWGVSLSVGLVVFMVVLETLFPHWLTNQADPLQAKFDIVFAVIILSFLLAWVIHFMLKVYKEQLERAEHANQTKSLFLSQVSHELRTPLNAVIGFSGQIIQKSERLSAEKKKMYAQKIHANGEHLLSLVNQVLDISLIETGKIELFWQEFELNTILLNIKDVVLIDAQNKNLEYILELPEQMITVESDSNRIRQILINMINNAIKYTSQGTVTCILRPLREGVEIEVQDTGSGIPMEQKNHIFEPFVRLDEHHGIQGNGLGLSISQTICKHLGCRIELKNSSKQGSVFTVFIPYKKTTPQKELS